MEKKKNTLTRKQLDHFKAILLAKRAEILGNVTSMEDESLRKQSTDLSKLPIHMADVGSDNYELENSIGLMDGERRILRDIDAALGRLEEGAYGICEGNEEPIPLARLNAIPWTRYCVKCAELVEKGTLRTGRASRVAAYDFRGASDEQDEDEIYRKSNES
jgi:DnaK suppressor protein